jgi:lipoate---protein ligase
MWIDDQILSQCNKKTFFKIWSPSKSYVVIGNSNDPNKEVYLNRCQQDDIIVVRRSGGGGTVLLHPETLIISLGCWVKDFYNNKEYFFRINESVINTLEKITSCPKLSQKGLSDICYQDKKLAGTSLFRSRNYLLYQASVLYSKKINKISYYLPHPSSEPSYRKKKSHKDFLTSLSEICDCNNLQTLRENFKNNFSHFFSESMSTKIIEPNTSQISHILKRTERANPLSL